LKRNRFQCQPSSDTEPTDAKAPALEIAPLELPDTAARTYLSKLGAGCVYVISGPRGYPCLLGASGAGKSVVLKLILGLLRPDAGSVLVNDVLTNGGTVDGGVVGDAVVAAAVVDVTVDDVAPGVVSWPLMIRSRASRWRASARLSTMGSASPLPMWIAPGYLKMPATLRPSSGVSPCLPRS